MLCLGNLNPSQYEVCNVGEFLNHLPCSKPSNTAKSMSFHQSIRFVLVVISKQVL